MQLQRCYRKLKSWHEVFTKFFSFPDDEPEPWEAVITQFYVSVNSKPAHSPGQKRVQNSHPRAYKNELKPHPQGHFPELFTIKT